MEYKYRLQRYAGRATRHECPNCGQRSFTLYIDENGNPIDESCGRCDHQSKCGYHLTPMKWFTLHPDQRTERKAEIRRVEPPKAEHVDYIPFDLIERSRSEKNGFMQYLCKHFDAENVRAVAEMYFLGSGKDGSILYPLIDADGNCRSGKFMRYDADGHRLRNGDFDAVDWLHSRMMRSQGKRSSDFHLRQCLFGEHLLRLFPDKPVCLVEGEKTAVICAILMPDFLWLATGGKVNFRPDVVCVLEGRKVVVFEDADVYRSGEWRNRSERFTFLSFQFSEWAAGEPEGSKRDIADLLMEKL